MDSSKIVAHPVIVLYLGDLIEIVVASVCSEVPVRIVYGQEPNRFERTRLLGDLGASLRAPVTMLLPGLGLASNHRIRRLFFR